MKKKRGSRENSENSRMNTIFYFQEGVMCCKSWSLIGYLFIDNILLTGLDCTGKEYIIEILGGIPYYTILNLKLEMEIAISI